MRLICLLLLLLGIGWWRTHLYLGNFDIQLSRTTYDAGPVATGHFMHSRNDFARDIEMNLSYRQWLPSLLFSSTVILYQVFHVPPESSALIFVYLQNLLLLAAIYFLSWKISKSYSISFLAALYVMWFTPQFYNLSFYGELLWMPYAGHLSLPFFIFAFGLLFGDHWRLALTLLFIGGLIHITLGLQAAGIIGLYWCYSEVFKNETILLRNFLQRRFVFLGVIVLCLMVLPKFFVSGIKSIDPKEAYLLVSGVVHQVPWLAGWDPFIQKLYAVLTKLGLASLIIFCFGKSLATESKSLWWSVVAATAVLSFTNVLGVFAQSSLLLQISGLRSSTFLILVSIPLIFSPLFITNEIQIFSVRKLAASSLLFMLGAFVAFRLLSESAVSDEKMKVFSILLGISCLVNLVFKAKAKDVFLLPLGSLVFLSALEFIKKVSLFAPPLNQWTSKESILAVFVISLVVIATSLFLKRILWRQLASTLIGCTLVVSGFIEAEAYGRERTTGYWKSLYEAQIWARDNSPPGSHFILMDLMSPFQSWRTLTRRGVVAQAMPFGNQYFYSQQMIAYTEELNAFYGSPNPEHYFIFDQNNENIVRLKMYEQFRALNEEQIRAFAKKFGGNYIVRKSSEKKLNFAIAYRNDYVTIYSVENLTRDSE